MGLIALSLVALAAGIVLTVMGTGAFVGIPLILLGGGLALWGLVRDRRKTA